MYRSFQAAGVLGKTAHLALLGVAILFVGPVALGLGAAFLGIVVAVVATMLPFVVIGAIAYAPVLLVRRMRGYSEKPVARDVKFGMPGMPRLQTAAVKLAVNRPEPAPLPRRQRGVVRRMVAEVMSGAIVGGVLGTVAVLGAVGDWQTSALIDYSALGAGIGAVVGFVVGGPRPTPVEKSVAIG